MIIKYCKREHNVAETSSRLKLGSLNGFKRMEEPNIGDPYEGKADYELGDLGGEVFTDENSDRLAQLTSGTIRIGPGGTFTSCAPLVILKSSPNVLLFCASLENRLPEKPVSVPHLSAEYDSFYRVTNLEAFVVYVLDDLRAQLGARVSGVIAKCRPVSYRSEERDPVSAKQSDAGERISGITNEAIFEKRAEFACQRELRIAIFPVDQGDRLVPLPEEEFFIEGPFPGVGSE